jgi:catechol 2,3-dioxygenase-like lactoylglutathione lyase family enzyme
MKQNIVHVALVVKDYDEAIDFYVNKLKFELLEDSYQARTRAVYWQPSWWQGIFILKYR